MTNLVVKKVNSLPGIKDPNTLYLVKSVTSGLLEIYLTNNDATDVRHGIINTDVSNIINSLDLVYILRNINNDVIDLVDKNNISTLKKSIFTLSTLPPTSSVELGAVVNIPKSEFTNNASIPGDGIYLKNDGDNWVTAIPNQIFSIADGTSAAPLASFNAATLGTNKGMFILPNGNPTIPYQLMHVGMRIRISAVFRFNTNTTAAIFGNGFGKFNSVSNPYAGSINTTATANKNIEIVSEIYVSSANSYTVKSIVKNSPSTTPVEGYVTDINSSLDWSSFGDHYVNFFVDPDAADVSGLYDLINYKVELIS